MKKIKVIDNQLSKKLTVLLKRNVFFNGKLVLGFQLFSLVKNKDDNYEVNNHHQSLISLFYIV